VAIKKVDQLVVPAKIQQAAESDTKDSPSSKAKNSRDHVDAINQMFAEFELAYHNQYHKAYPDEATLNLAKKYWLSSLAVFTPEMLLAATRELVLKQTFLPTLANVVDACKSGMNLFGLPAAHDAYLEACRKPAPKVEQDWSHPAVYLAGKTTGWFELANQTEAQIFPLFEYYYTQLVQRVLQGEELSLNVPTPLPETVHTPLSAKENQSRLQQLKNNLKL
jgi:hypothetical protein